MRKTTNIAATITVILIVAIAALALTALITPVSAVDIGTHNITFINHTYDPATCYSTWWYNVTSGPKDLSHWVMSWCNESALIGCSETCVYVVNDPGDTGLTGIKFEGTYEAGKSKTVWFKLKGCGDYYEKDRYVGIKAGGDPAEYGNVTGPKGLAADPCAPIPDLPAIILFASGLVLVSVYFVYGRRGRGIANSQ